MTGSEIFTSLRNVFLNRHVWIAEANQTNFVTFFRRDSKFLTAARIPTRLVVAVKNFSGNADFGHQSSGLSLDHSARRFFEDFLPAYLPPDSL